MIVRRILPLKYSIFQGLFAYYMSKKGEFCMKVKERFLEYVSYDTRSDPKSGSHPSTENQKILAYRLVEDMKSIGIDNACTDEFGYVYGYIQATPGHEQEKPLGLIAHMDTSPDMPGNNVKPKIIEKYNGRDIALNSQVVMKVSEHASLKAYVGKTLITTDGTTLLGSDDKAGIAEIMEAVELMKTDKIPHGPIYVAFTPDEEIGEGADRFDLKKFGADYAYTVDGGALGELEYENFNAASAKVTVKGVNIHPGEAKDKMKNSVLMANQFISGLPVFETPSQTSGYEGFFHVTDIKGSVEHTEINILIRDHSMEIFNGRKDFLRKLSDKLNGKYGEGTFSIEIKDSYYNMKEMVAPHMEIVDRAKNAMTACGVKPRIIPIRGGTDGARLSYLGLPCPNLSTGGHNFHGVYEYIPVESMETMVRVLCLIMKADGAQD